MPLNRLLYILSFIIALTIVDYANASTFHDQPYGYAPRVVEYCQQGFAGYEYSPIKERQCRPLWDMFTREIYLESHYLFNL